MELAEALKQQGRLQDAQKVFGTARRIATTVRLDELIRGADAEFQQPVGDTAAGAQLPAPVGPPPAAKTDTTSKPGAKPPRQGSKRTPR
jgi:hypothetical protein